MRWYKNFYAGKSIEKKKQKIKWKVNHNAGQLEIYLITLAANKENLLDIIPSWELMQKYYPKKNLYILGIAGGYEEALELAGSIVTEVYQKTNGFNLHQFFQKEQNRKSME